MKLSASTAALKTAAMARSSANHHIIHIAAHSRELIIGANSILPWKLPVDFDRFLRLSQDTQHAVDGVIMGRKVYEELSSFGMIPFLKKEKETASAATSPRIHVVVSKSLMLKHAAATLQQQDGDDDGAFIFVDSIESALDQFNVITQRQQRGTSGGDVSSVETEKEKQPTETSNNKVHRFVYLLGGESIYEEMLPWSSALRMTQIDFDYEPILAQRFKKEKNSSVEAVSFTKFPPYMHLVSDEDEKTDGANNVVFVQVPGSVEDRLDVVDECDDNRVVVATPVGGDGDKKMNEEEGQQVRVNLRFVDYVRKDLMLSASDGDTDHPHNVVSPPPRAAAVASAEEEVFSFREGFWETFRRNGR